MTIKERLASLEKRVSHMENLPGHIRLTHRFREEWLSDPDKVNTNKELDQLEEAIAEREKARGIGVQGEEDSDTDSDADTDQDKEEA
jgi:hypothetical protein